LLHKCLNGFRVQRCKYVMTVVTSGTTAGAGFGVHACDERLLPTGTASGHPRYGRDTQLFHSGRQCSESAAGSLPFDHRPGQRCSRSGQLSPPVFIDTFSICCPFIDLPCSPASGFRPFSLHVVCAESFSHWLGLMDGLLGLNGILSTQIAAISCHTGQGLCGTNLCKWSLAYSDKCKCVIAQTMSNIVNERPLVMLSDGGLQRLHLLMMTRLTGWNKWR